MRLLNVETLDFAEFVGEVGDGIPPYAILSHTWGDEEVTYKDHIEQTALLKRGYDKIHSCRRLADSEGFQYIWIDTCCIDKSSSAELSEAINSMFNWYRDAGICYAYLSDVHSSEDPTAETSSFARSRWFSRGWTLQELLAPTEVVFLGSDWVEIGTKKSLRSLVSRITRIDAKVLNECSWSEYSVAQKMSWAAGRRTTRPEDGAYCLMGLFDVNMPLLYGEGHKAFSRLQQEILKQSDDQSIFAWSCPEEDHSHTQLTGLLAPSPESFRSASHIGLLGHGLGEEYGNSFEVVNQLIRLTLRVVDDVKAMKLQRLRMKPCLYNIVEVQQGQKRERSGEAHPAPALPSDLQQDDAGVINRDASMVGMQESSPAAIITIGAEGLDKDLSVRVSEYSSGFQDDTAVAFSQAADNDSGRSETAPRESLPDEHNGYNHSPEPGNPTVTEIWRWYIYEPVVIVPLRCHIDGRRLGILLSRGSIAGQGGHLSRLHNPSIIATEAVQHVLLTPPITTYASMSTKYSRSPGARIFRLFGLNRLRWPEIRIASLLSAGYTIHAGNPPGWIFDRSRAALVQMREFQEEADMTEYAPLVVFSRNSSDEAPWAFFFSIPVYEKSSMRCEVGVLKAGTAPFIVTDHSLYSSELARERWTQISLGDGQALVAKYREGGVNFVSLSVGTLDENAVAIPMSQDTEKTVWMKSKLFHLLRSKRPSGPSL